MTSWVLTPCHRGRLVELRAMIASLVVDPEQVVVVTTLPDPIQPRDLDGAANHLLVFEKPGMLFGEWLNYGLTYLSCWSEPYEVLCIGSSLLGAEHTLPTLRRALRGEQLAMCGPDMFGRLAGMEVETHREDQRTLWNRVTPICFMVPGELGLRFDEQFRWWYGEDDLEMQARQHGPVGLVGGCGVTATVPNGHPLSEQQFRWAVEDRAKFVDKWRIEPW